MGWAWCESRCVAEVIVCPKGCFAYVSWVLGMGKRKVMALREYCLKLDE